jgi:uncharacterized cupredoxin-like copper-binding protein
MNRSRIATLLDHSYSRRTLVQRAAIAGAGAGVALAAGGGRFAMAHQDTAGEGAYPEVVIVAREMAFEVAESFEGGFVQLTLDNQGAMDHHVMMMRVNDDATVDDVLAALAEPSFEAVFGVSTSLGGPAAGPGLSASVVVDLPAGSYVLICAIPGPDGMPHYQMGMQATVEVTEPAAALEAPTADATVELMEMMFHGMGETYAAGPTTWEVVNAGAAIHELLVMQLAEGFTGEMFLETVLAPPTEATPAEPQAAGPPPFEVIGGVAPMNPGFTNYLPLDLVAGEYVAICFVPDPETGAPHAALGMVMPFVVE